MHLFLFHRDLRLFDNTGFIAACRSTGPVLPVFIFPPEQIDPSKNSYYSPYAVHFMLECLRDLDSSLQKGLHVYQGDTLAVLKSLFQSRSMSITHLSTNEDHSVYATQRDAAIRALCEKHGVQFQAYQDYTLTPLKSGLVEGTRPYTNLSQFYTRFLKDPELVPPKPASVPKKLQLAPKPPKEHSLEYVLAKLTIPQLPEGAKPICGGRPAGLAILRRIQRGDFRKYEATRNLPANEEGTTKLSAYLKFGAISIREAYAAAVAGHGGSRDNALVRELVFREFYHKIYALRPELQRGVAYREALDKKIRWKDSRAPQWERWVSGTTGYPLVDAGMRQLRATGWMHNRIRMVVASVATRYYELDWRLCAQYFYRQLIDADPFSNTAGWAWAAGIGVDSAPYFRKPFNPFRQSKKYDPDAVYIKRWLPELSDIPASDLHRLNEPKIRAKYATHPYVVSLELVGLSRDL